MSLVLTIWEGARLVFTLPFSDLVSPKAHVDFPLAGTAPKCSRSPLRLLIRCSYQLVFIYLTQRQMHPRRSLFFCQHNDACYLYQKLLTSILNFRRPPLSVGLLDVGSTFSATISLPVEGMRMCAPCGLIHGRQHRKGKPVLRHTHTTGAYLEK